MAINATSNQSKVPVIAGAAIGAAAGGVGTWKGAPIIAKKFELAKDTYVNSAIEKNLEKLSDAGITKRSQKSKILTNVVNKASQDFKNSHKILTKVSDFIKNHKNATIAVGAAALAVAGGIIGKAIANNKADKAE